MPEAQAAAQPAQGEGQGENKFSGIIRTVVMVFGMQMALKYGMQYLGIGPQPSSAPAPADPASGPAAAAAAAAGATGDAAAAKVSLVATPAWDNGTPMTMLLYANTAEDFSPSAVNLASPTVRWDGLTLGNWDDAREKDLLLDVPLNVRADNASWYMDILLVKDGGLPFDRASTDVAHHRKELTRWLPKKRVRKEVSLLGAKNETAEETADDEPVGPPPIVSYWARNLTVTVVANAGAADLSQVQAPVASNYKVAGRGPDGKLTYFPIIFANDFWLLKENLVPINETTKQLPVRVTYGAISNFKFSTFAALTASFEQSAQQQGTGAELDEVKRMLTETNPILLITTALVTVLHMVFEFLAFSSDVQHWRQKDKNKDLVGVSLRTILTNCFVQLIILLYLHDSSEETSWMILFTQGIGLVIEAWKITKVTNVRIRPANNIIGYKIVFEDKHVLSEEEKKTQEYDALAFRLVSYVAIPVLAGYAVYSLLYLTHRSWYSFVITTLAQAIYMFGFVQLVPQLIINYKLKTVAHMPMKAMIYKTLSTVVDDFFAFCVKMPWLHRLACFRDDLVYMVMIYQKFIYPTDYTRTNEYGQVGEDDVAVPKEKKDASKAAKVAESKKDQ